MHPDKHRIDSIFLAAAEKATADERAAYLDGACGSDRELRERVDRLLAAQSKVHSFLEAPAPALVATVDEPRVTERPGTLIGPYKLLEQIGEGGFGAVFMAEQSEPIRRKVALKVLKPGMDTRQVVARFEAERQALALMDHPNIARVLDGGQTGSGRPYFVMDLVKGLPITDFCDQAQLAPRERLELFVHLCQAVQHAHQKGIIHRDLKPSNVLVTMHDGTPLVKVIDFGIAKALGQSLTDKTLFTGFAQMVGTPLYMSPEQAALSNIDVDTRSDIYSLGVLLYELLTGTTPFDKERLKEIGFDELQRIIREEEPPRPSTRISTLGQAATSVSAQRKSDPRRLSQLCRGELDWIVMKCLEKDRNRRYETASAFAADVQRYLADEPVLACPPSAWYRFGKFTRRNKAALAVATCLFLAVAGIASGVGWAVRDRDAREEGIERERLAREAALDEKVEETLDTTGPLIEQENWPEALAAVERADQLLAAAGRAERPPRLLELRKELSMALRLEEIYRQPQPNLETGEAVVQDAAGTRRGPRRQHSAEEDDLFWNRKLDTLFAEAFREFGIDIDAVTPAEAAAAVQRRHIRAGLVKALDGWAPWRRAGRGENDPGWKKLIAIAQLADPDPWRNRCREALRRRDRRALEELAGTVPVQQVSPRTLWLLGLTLKEVGAPDQAMALLRRAQHEYPTDLWINDTLGGFSLYEFKPSRLDDALRFYSIALALRPARPQLHYIVGDILCLKGAVEDGVVELSKAIDLDPKYGHALHGRAVVYSNLHQYGKALADRTRIIDLEPKNAWAWTNRAVAYWNLHKYDKALADCTKAIELDPKYAEVWLMHGGLLVLAGDIAGYQAFCKRLRDELYPKLAPATDGRPAYLLARTCLLAPGGIDPAAAVRLAEEALTAMPRAAWYLHTLALAHYRAGQYLQAVERLQRSIEVDPAWAGRVDDWLLLGLAHQRLGHTAEAAQWLARAVDALPSGGFFDEHGTHMHDRLACEVLRREADVFLKQADAASAHNYQGITLKAGRDLDGALAEFRQAIASDPTFAPAHLNLGNALSAKGQLDEAITAYRKVIELDPKNGAAWYNRGCTYEQLKQYDKAVGDYTRAVELEPKHPYAWANRGRANASLRRWDKALADFSRSIEIIPNALLPWCFRALVRLHSDDRAGYRKDCAAMRQQVGASANPDVVMWTVWTCLQVPDAVDDWPKLAQWAEKALAADPKEHNRLNFLGGLLYRAGRFKEAVQRLSEAEAAFDKAKGPHSIAYTWLFRAMAEERLGNTAKAREWLAKAVHQIERVAADKDNDLRWNQQLTLRLLRKEAETLLKIDKEPKSEERKR
jgi:serine/threonine protein kinase/Tfp pilus assembly protein PilF